MKQSVLYLVILLFTVTAAAERGMAKPGGGKRGHHKQMMQELDLTPEQRKEIKDLRKSFRDEVEGLKESVHTEQQKMHELMKGDAADAQILSQHDKAHDLRGQIAKKRLEMMLKIRAILTPEQRQKFAESLPDKPWGKHGKRGKRGKHQGPPPDDFLGLDDEDD